MKAVFRGKLTAFNAYTRKKERSKIANLSFYLKKLEKEEIIKSKLRRKEIRRTRVEIDEIENRRSIEKNQ